MTQSSLGIIPNAVFMQSGCIRVADHQVLQAWKFSFHLSAERGALDDSYHSALKYLFSQVDDEVHVDVRGRCNFGTRLGRDMTIFNF